MKHRELLADLDGAYQEIAGSDVGEALASFAKAERATQIVLGSSRRSRWAEATRGSVISRVLRATDEIDVHVISTKETEEPAGVPSFARRRPPSISRRRQGTALLRRGRAHPAAHADHGRAAQPAQPPQRAAHLPAQRHGGRGRGRLRPGRDRRGRRVPAARTGSSPRRSTPSRSPRTTTSSRSSCSWSSPRSSVSSSARPRADEPRPPRCRPTPRRSPT